MGFAGEMICNHEQEVEITELGSSERVFLCSICGRERREPAQ